MSNLLEIDKVSKTFGSVRANDAISLTVAPGEIVALLGENGAGKSTLVKAVYGLVKPDSGTIKINGTLMEPGDTASAIANGVGMFHQHFQFTAHFHLKGTFNFIFKHQFDQLITLKCKRNFQNDNWLNLENIYPTNIFHRHP